MKDNELIAEFMGVGKHYEAQSSNQFNQYNTSWDWLMPVVNKCFQYGELHNSYREQIIESLSGVIDIEDTCKAVVEFIKDCEEKKVIVKDLHGLDDDTISKIETPMFLIGDWVEDETTFADLRNSKGQVVRIFHERLEDYKKKAYKIDEDQNHIMGGVDFSESINQLNNLL